MFITRKYWKTNKNKNKRKMYKKPILKLKVNKVSKYREIIFKMSRIIKINSNNKNILKRNTLTMTRQVRGLKKLYLNILYNLRMVDFIQLNKCNKNEV